jgi:hypothetical protein
MRITCWVIKATEGRSEYLILNACPLQQLKNSQMSIFMLLRPLARVVVVELFRTKGRRGRQKHDGAKSRFLQVLRTCLINSCYFCNLLVFVSEMS